MRQPSELPIGVFDSGIGGLTVARQIRRVLPLEDLIYLGDTARVPYGTKSPEAVIRFACEDTRFLLHQGVKAVVVACNTASAWALPALQEQFQVPVFGVVEPGVRAALKTPGSERIGIIGTTATIRSQAYRRAILERQPGVKVFSRACPLLVPLVEEGWVSHRITRMVLAEYLRPLLQKRVGVLVLACTHYPLLKRVLRLELRGRATLVDSAESCAKSLKEELAKRKLLCHRSGREGSIELYLTDEIPRVQAFARRFLGSTPARVTRTELPM